MVNLRLLVWDDFNIEHIFEHDFSPDDVEQVCHSRHHASETYSGRLRLIGPNAKGRLLTVILAPKGDGAYYAVSVRPASVKERRLYRAEIGGEAA